MANRKSSPGVFLKLHNALFSYMCRAGLILSAIPMVADSLDSIPEAQRSLYKEVNGKFTLDVEGYEDPVGLKSALTKERERAGNAEKQANAWRALGKTPEEIQVLVAAQTQAETDKLAKAGEWDKLRGQMNDQHATALKAETDKVAAKDKALSKYLVDSAAVSAIAAAKGVPELLLPHVRGAVKVVEDNGEYVVRVVDATGNPRVNGKGEFLSIADLVGEMRSSEVFGRAFESSGASGGGASGGVAAGQKTITQAQFDAMTPVARAVAFKSGVTLKD